MTGTQSLGRGLQVAAWMTFAWAAWNCVYVMDILAGARVYRLESSVLLFAVAMLPATFFWRGQFHDSDLRWLIPVALLLWVAAVVPLSRYPFTSDDYVFLARYSNVSDILHPSQFFRPAFAALFLLCRYVGRGGSSVPFHVAAYAMHLGCAACAYVLAQRLSSSKAIASLATCIFLLNPTQLEATVWVSGMQEGLWTMLVLLTAVFHTADRSSSTDTMALACGALALLSKETAVCFPAVLALLDLCLGGASRVRLSLRRYSVYVALVIVFIAVRSRFASTVDAQLWFEPSRYWLKQFVLAPYRILALPWNGEAIWVPRALQTFLGLSYLTILRFGVVRPPALTLVGPLLIITTTAPLLGYLFVSSDLSGSRYLYCGVFGWGITLSALLLRATRRRTFQNITACMLVVLLATALIPNRRPWFTAMRLVSALQDANSSESVAGIVQRFETSNGVPVRRTPSGDPDSIHGVYILRNGGQEFRARFGVR